MIPRDSPLTLRLVENLGKLLFFDKHNFALGNLLDLSYSFMALLSVVVSVCACWEGLLGDRKGEGLEDSYQC